VYLV
jgi:hypothetical protein